MNHRFCGVWGDTMGSSSGRGHAEMLLDLLGRIHVRRSHWVISLNSIPRSESVAEKFVKHFFSKKAVLPWLRSLSANWADANKQSQFCSNLSNLACTISRLRCLSRWKEVPVLPARDLQLRRITRDGPFSTVAKPIFASKQWFVSIYIFEIKLVYKICARAETKQSE